MVVPGASFGEGFISRWRMTRSTTVILDGPVAEIRLPVAGCWLLVAIATFNVAFADNSQLTTDNSQLTTDNSQLTSPRVSRRLY